MRGSRRRSLPLMALLLAVALLGAACGGNGDGNGGAEIDDGGEPQQGGTIVFGAEQEPAEGLNGDLVCCTLFWQRVLIDPTLYGAYQAQPDFTYKPQLLDGEAEITEDPFTITYKLLDEAVWSDGEPISAEDMEFTWQLFMDPKNNVASRAGYDQIKDAEIMDEKTIKFTFKKPYAGWKELFVYIYPKHALEGENFNKVWTDEIVNPKTGEPIASGPFIFDSYKKGSQLTLVRNENFWGQKAYLDEIVFRFVPETNTEIQQLRGGEVDAIYPQPQLQLVDLTTQPDLEVQTSAGTTWEHIDFQYGNPLLANDYVRQAIAHGIDREALTSQLFKDLAPELAPLNNLIYMSNAPEYEEHFQIWDHDPAKATQLLEDNGCTKGGDGIYECDGQRLSFGFKSTAGNELRELAFEVIQAQLKEVGIEVKSEFGDAAVVFGSKGLVGGRYDLFMFAWVGNPDPSGSVEIHKCKGSQNFQNYCNEEVTDLLEQTDEILDPAQRAAVFNEADALMAEDLPILPLYQKPTFFAFNAKLHNAEDNPTQEGPTWNAGEWWIEQ